jgi:hypothetical protein
LWYNSDKKVEGNLMGIHVDEFVMMMLMWSGSRKRGGSSADCSSVRFSPKEVTMDSIAF